MLAIKVIFWGCLGVIFYTYLGYPLLLAVMRGFKKQKRVTDEFFMPAVSFIVIAYNEEAAIEQKIKNCLALDYPKSKMEFIFVSDASTDGTDAILRKYSDQGIIYLRQPHRQGKNEGLNRAREIARMPIHVFSDANTFFDPQAVKKMVRHMKDEKVGFVIGESRYMKNYHPKAESLYWSYENWVKKMEDDIDGTFCGDGAIYAARSADFLKLVNAEIDDMIVPLRFLERGYQGIYESEAVGYEELEDNILFEFHRRIRIVSRAFPSLWEMKKVLNPFRHGFLSLEIISHKVLRWFLFVFIAGMYLSNLFLIQEGGIYPLMFALQSASVCAGILGFISYRWFRLENQLIYIPFYFYLLQWTALQGIFVGIWGRKITHWDHARQNK